MELTTTATATTGAADADRKQKLIDRVINEPLDFSDADFQELVSKDLKLSFGDLRQLITRIFDINETTLLEQSDATKDFLGRLNKSSTRLRHKKYYRQIDNGFRDARHTHHKLIVAEGDSWFQFPVFVHDIIDWLGENPNYAIYSIAYGGDWFTNILYEEKYIEELSIHQPDVFLISGGGNDFLGSNRLAIMVNPDCNCRMRSATDLDKMFAVTADEKHRAAILDGYRSVNPAFYSFIWTIKAQYYILFRNLHESGKFNNMLMITQGYDYAIPSFKKRRRHFFDLQPLVNRLIGTGKWMKRPLLIKGITDDVTSGNIIKALIFELNYMFYELAQNPLFPNVYHIDCRGVAPAFDDWYDELHLRSEKYRVIANAFANCIENPPANKVYRVVP